MVCMDLPPGFAVMDHPNLAVINFMEKSIGLKRVKVVDSFTEESKQKGWNHLIKYFSLHATFILY